ncbi:putative nucleic acid-binding Zn finger protein [Methanolinea mesophila]|uniref:SWIM zinc finger family protein n=1 Tax=Methanolinea mesophila TaxID=547055 RepID=UPI001AE7058F|nr:SWIM zinc finger family protein [Methanolinea mesophila]MBP1929659.1 putative nucleic acid-binding Zn finger protein [Methanolinea mesophila]
MDFRELVETICREKSLTPALEEKILDVWKSRGRKAIDAVNEGRVLRYLDFYVVEGGSGEYIVDEEFCTCRDFVFRGGTCWHILAVMIACCTGRDVPVQRWYQERWTGGKHP